MHVRPAYPLASLACPLPPCSAGEPGLRVPLPSHYHRRPGGAARALRGEAAGSGHSAASAQHPDIWSKSAHHVFMDEQTQCCLLLIVVLWKLIELLCAPHRIICVCALASVCSWSVPACPPVSGRVSHDQL